MALPGTHAHFLASITGSVTAQRVAAALSDGLRDAVLGNSDCDPDLWCELYTTKGPRKLSPAAAKAAVAYPLTDRQADHLLGCEKRSSVLSAAFETWKPTTEQLIAAPLRKMLGEERFAKKVANTYVCALDLDLLATVPAADVNERLRVWRLLAPTLSDDEVVSELAGYDTWASPYVQQPVGWVLHQRPHLLEQVADMTSVSVRMQAATGPHMGSLDPATQARLLDLTTDPAGQGWLNDRAFLWLAGVANPTVSVDLVDDLTARLEAQTELFDASATARNRREHNNWSVASIAEPLTESQMDRVLRWAAPYNGKAKLAAVDQLVDNPSLDEASADRLGGSLETAPRPPLWRTDAARDILARLVARYPDLDRYRLLADWEDPHRHPGEPATEQPARQPDPNGGRHRVEYGLSSYTVGWLDARIGADTGTWQKVFELIDTMPQVTLADLADTCEAMGI